MLTIQKSYKMSRYLMFVLFAVGIVSNIACCSSTIDDNGNGDVDDPSLIPDVEERYPSIKSDGMPEPQTNGDIIPDFSRVGYRWGDEDIPNYNVVKTVYPRPDGSDATELIQHAIDQVDKGAILLKAGVYNIHGEIKINRSNIVLRGEGAGKTILVAAGTEKRGSLISICSGNESINSGSAIEMKNEYIPCGQFWMPVSDVSVFSVGDEVIVHRPSTQNWISDIKMDQIPPRPDGGVTNQWKAGSYDLHAERIITLIIGDTVHFENPIVMSLDKNYGGGSIMKYSYSNRIMESGVEDLSIEAEYDRSSKVEESYVRSAIDVRVAEHCWVTNIDTKYFGMGLVVMSEHSKNITVSDCECIDPKSEDDGGNRYSFYIENGTLCLVENCFSSDARHDYATGPRSMGPNAFVNCEAVNTLADIGPHHRWNCGTLYDNIITDGEINIQDRSWLGSGQGWAGVNSVVWNSNAKSLAIQSPWVSAYNYSIGNLGVVDEGMFLGRPEAVNVSSGAHVAPKSLYSAQLELRLKTNSGGVMDIE